MENTNIGIVSLGDIILPVFDAAAHLPAEQRVLAMTYRPDQKHGLIRLVSYESEAARKGKILCERSISTGGGRAAENSIPLVMRCEEGSLQIRIQTGDKPGEQSVHETFSIALDPADAAYLTFSHDAMNLWRRKQVHAEILLRWLRTLLRERPARIATRGSFHDFANLCEAVEKATEGEDPVVLDKSVDELMNKANALTKKLNIPCFPTDSNLAFLPET